MFKTVCQQEPVRRNTQRGVMMKATPVSSLVMAQANSCFNSSVVPLNAPRILATRTNSRSGVEAGNVESQYFVGSASPRGHSISNHSVSRRLLRFSSRCAARTRSAAKRDDSTAWLPSRQFTVCQRRAFKDSATALTLTGEAPTPRRHLVGGRPIFLRRLGGSGPVPANHTVVLDCTPTQYSNSISLSPSRHAVSLP